MTLENEMERLSKLQKSGDATLQKHMDKMSDIFLSAEHNSLMKENNARQQYEWVFDFYCREAEEAKQDLWVYLSNKFMISEERHLIKPPNTLKNKKKEQDWIKKEFWPYFYEYIFNCFRFKVTNKFSEVKGKNMDGGEIRGEQETQEKIARQEPIIQKREELIDSGVKDEKEIIKRIRKAFPKEDYDYIQKTILAKKRKEQHQRRVQKPFALSP